MSFRWVLIGGSLLAHGGIVVALGGIRAPASLAATAIEVTETTREPPPPARVEAPPPPSELAPRARSRAKATEAPPADVAPKTPSSSLANLPDFGLELSGGGAPGGLAVARPADPAPRAAPVTKTLERTPAPQKDADGCAEGPSKPKLLDLPRPTYTEAARAAGLEGKVRVELTVDESGRVVAVRALSTLGLGLDEAALAAAKAASFEPAMRCGRPSRSTFTISIRFAAS
ncbi:MAG: TonB family protein [Labilithrix sp.]|nr:TonB family protein [Labilithrix sp.]